MARLMSPDRMACVIPGCPRTMAHQSAVDRWGYVPGEWICQKHWSRLTPVERRVWTRIKRAARRYGPDAIPRERSARLWAALRRRASERAPIPGI